jgi:hypothetical protein
MGSIIIDLTSTFKMSSTNEFTLLLSMENFTSIQRVLMDLFQNGHSMSPEQVNQAVDGLSGQALQMVRRRQLENAPPAPPVPPVARQVGSAPFTMGPFTMGNVRPNSGPYTAPLRPTESAHQRRNPLEKTVTIKKTEFDAICTDLCPICIEPQKKGDTIMTDCNHEFCKPCYNSWMTAFTSNHTCPACRKLMPRVTSFKIRATKKLTGPASAPVRRGIIIEEDD